jgi:hypothetical protein
MPTAVVPMAGSVPRPVTCGARKKQGEGVCTQAAGWGTDHPGEGRCKLHGGKNPIKHGRFSAIKRPELRELVAAYEQDPDPLNILPELALVRAQLVDYVNRYDEHTAALLAWHESYRAGMAPLDPAKVLALKAVLDEYEELAAGADGLTDTQREDLAAARACVDRLASGAGDVPGKPRQMLDVASAYQMASEVTKIVERIERIRAANAVSRADLVRIMTEMGRVVEAYVRDDGTQQKIREGWLGIRIAA